MSKVVIWFVNLDVNGVHSFLNLNNQKIWIFNQIFFSPRFLQQIVINYRMDYLIKITLVSLYLEMESIYTYIFWRGVIIRNTNGLLFLYKKLQRIFILLYFYNYKDRNSRSI